MGRQAFGFGERDGRRADGGQGFRPRFNHRTALHEIKYAKTRGKTGASVRRQNVVGASQIITQGFRRIATQEYGTGISDLFGQGPGLIERQFQMFRSKLVDQGGWRVRNHRLQ